MSNQELPPSTNREYVNFLAWVRATHNTLLGSTLEFDDRLTELQGEISDSQRRSPLDIARLKTSLADLQDDMDLRLDQPFNTNNSTWNDYFHLLNHRRFLEQRLMTPYAFAEPRRHELRRQLSEGTYGLSAEILEFGLELYNQPDLPEKERGELIGALNEETVTALLNRPQSPYEMAFATSTIDDHLHKRDVEFWYIDNGKPHNVGIQVKSKLPPYEVYRSHAEKPLIYIYGDDFDNRTATTRLETTRRIIEEVNGTISDEDAHKLDITRTKLMIQLFHRITTTNSH